MDKDFIRYNDILELRGEAVEGAADKWLDAVNRDTQSRLEKMDPARREDYNDRITPWIAGKYENLLRHERREVRKGRIERLELDNAADCERESFDVQKQAVAIDESYAHNLAMAAETRDDYVRMGNADEGERYFEAVSKNVADARARETESLILQIGATGAIGEDRIGSAVSQGLIDEPTGEMMRRKHRRTILSSAVNSFLESDKADQADAFIAAMEANDGAIARSAGFTPDELAKLKTASAAARRRGEAKAKAAEQEVRRVVLDQIAKEDIEVAKVPFPETSEERTALAQMEAARFDRYSSDERLEAATRAKYAEAARNVLAAERKLQANEKIANEKAASEAFENAILTTEARSVQLRSTGSAEDARKAVELESDLYLSVQRGFAQGLCPAKTYTDYMKRRGQQLTTDECRAMAKFDAALGIVGPETDERGDVKNEKSWARERLALRDGRRFPAESVLKFRKRFLAELRRQGKDVSREEVVARVIDNVTAEAFKERFSEEADSAVIAALEEAQSQVRFETGYRNGVRLKKDKDEKGKDGRNGKSETGKK